MNKNELSIVIVSYNTKDVTLQCLESIYKMTTGLTFEVIVVDNNSSDGSSEAIVKQFPQVIFIQSKSNSGFAAGQNLGIRHSTGAYVLILNSDIIFVENSCAILLKIFDKMDKTLGVVGPKILNQDGSHAISGRRSIISPWMMVLGIINRHFRFKRFLPKEAFLRKYFWWVLGTWHDNYRKEESSYPVDYIDGMCALVKRTVLEDVGLFDERYFFDYEIIDLANRIREKGWGIEYHAVTHLIHLGHVSRKKTSRIVLETHKSELIYYSTYSPKTVPIIKFTTQLVMKLKISLLHVVSFLSQSSYDGQIKIYRDILDLMSNFDENKSNKALIPRIG